MYSDKIRPYKGEEPYIFISYAHKDNDIVLSIMERMAQDGYRIWYDEGITPGSEWDDEIAEHIDKCDSFIAFISSNYLNSKNCKDELKFVRDLEKKLLLVYIENVPLPSGMALRLGRLQDVRFYEHKDNQNIFFEKLYLAKILDNSKADALSIVGTSSGSVPFQKPQPLPAPPVQPAPASLFGSAATTQTIPVSLFGQTPPPISSFPTKTPIQTPTTKSYVNPKHIVDSRYTLGEPIGHGGMANVYKAFDSFTQKNVSIKFYYKYQLVECPFFTEEAIHNTIMELNHPNLCKILDADEIADPYLVMEYIDGITLSEYLKESYYSTLDFRELLMVSRQVLEALFTLHNHHIFYGDVSPFNIVLSKNNQAYLIDYTECNFIGSPNPQKTTLLADIQSPEKATAETLDQRSDIYEFGKIFEKMLQTYVNRPYSIHRNNIVDIYDTPVFKIVRKATMINPNERYQSALEMLEAIDKVIEDYT